MSSLRSYFQRGVAASLRRHGVKVADLQTELKPHQQRVVDRILAEDQPGLVVAHGLGSGKTLTSIAAQEALGLPSNIVLPAALRQNYLKEIAKHTSGDAPDRTITSLQAAATQGAPSAQPLLIVDEAHRARDPGSKTYRALRDAAAEKRLLLTASPFYNHPADIAPLVNIAAGSPVFPADQAEFERRYVAAKQIEPSLLERLRGIQPGEVPILNPRKSKELKEQFAKWVDYYPGSTVDFPSVTREDVRVPMTPAQLKVYDTLVDRAPPWVAYKVKHNLPPSKREAKELNAFLSGIRQVSNTTAGFQREGDPQDPKIQAAFDNLKKQLEESERAKAVVYSNYLDAGLAPYKQRLEAAHIPYGEFTGEMPKEQRDELVRQYNEGKLRALLLSSAGGEGLDLKGTRLLQILEPHWNEEKLRQVEGRGIRYRSHADLPPEEQNVRVQRYLATRPASGVLERMGLRQPGASVDEYLARRSAEKEQLMSQFRDVLPLGSTG
jgi:SNF2 family DNA or RNA helicase